MDHLSFIKPILPFLPLSLSVTSSSSHLTWPEEAGRSLNDLTMGPAFSRVNSGAKLFEFIHKLRHELGLSSQPPLAFATSNGLSFFFGQHLSRDESKVWFDEVVPGLAALLLRLPSLLEAHYCNSDKLTGIEKSELRLLTSQHAGIVILNRELIAALLACAFFCLFPATDRVATHLSRINFDELFATLVNGRRQFQHQKLRCFMNYFQRICKDIPKGVISFERKVLSPSPCYDEEFWNNSDAALCPIQIFSSGSIEDQPHEALEIVFSNEYYGLNSIYMGCVQEQIRFMITPELVVGLLFIARMEENEAVQVVGVERFSQYTGEVNKAFVGFMESKYEFNFVDSQEYRSLSTNSDVNANTGIASGNWGCGVFGGNPQIKCMIQWMAASQAKRPFIHYYTFNEGSMQRAEQAIACIENQHWNVSDLWKQVMDYSLGKIKGGTTLDFFSWLQCKVECT